MKLTDKFEKLPGIYIITNLINGKQYIGETVNVKQRMKDHRSKKDGQVISCAIKKYGLENFEVEIRYWPNLEKESLLDLEEQLIIELDCLVPNGYNVCKRGRSVKGKPCSEETKKKLSLAHKGKVHSAETRQKISMARKGVKASEETKRKFSEARRGRKGLIVYTAEVRKNMSDAQMGKKLSDEHKLKLAAACRGKRDRAIVQICPKATTIIKVWKSAAEASEFFCNSRLAENIMHCLTGRNNRKTAYGFKWEYFDPEIHRV